MTAQAAPRSRRLPSFNWPWFALAALFIGYWFFVRSLERIDGAVVLASIFLPGLPPSQAALTPFNPAAIWLVEMFHPRVLRHFIPIIVGWRLAVEAAISLMQVLYNCPDRRTAAEFLRRQRRNGVNPAELPYTVLPEQLEQDREQSVLLRIGGPVRVGVPNGYAAVTERNARFLRVLPPGVHDLGRFEYVQAVVDLRPQDRSAKDVTMLTREGIPVRADIGLTFRIDPGDEATPARPFPFNAEAVRRAAYSGTVGPDGKVSSWADGALGKVRGALSEWVAQNPLDKLIADSTYDAHQFLTDYVRDKVWKALPKDGIKPLQMRIGSLLPPPAVSRQYTEHWLANQRRADLVAQANGTAHLVQEAETARVAAEIAMIHAIVEGVRRAQQEVGTDLTSYVLAVRLLEALQTMFQLSSDTLESIGGDTAHLLVKFNAARERLTDLQERLQLPPAKFNPSSAPD